MSQFASSPSPSDPSRIEVARGVIRFEPDFTAVEEKLSEIERRLDAIEERTQRFSAGDIQGRREDPGRDERASAEPARTRSDDGGRMEELIQLVSLLVDGQQAMNDHLARIASEGFSCR